MLRKTLSILLMLCFGPLLQAAPLSVGQVPEPLKPWVDWVLENEKDFQCPFFSGQFQSKRCVWPGRLRLKLDAAQGDFSGDWRVYRADWITLPGSEKHWPQSVAVNDKPVEVMLRGGKPAVWLEPGDHRVSGRFVWDAIPERLEIAEETGLLDLSVGGKPIPQPTLKQGSVWLRQSDIGRKKPENVQNRVDLQVFRKVVDDVPLQLVTYLELEVSGEQREVKLPHALLADFIPVDLNSPLPARIEADGVLLAQIRPGRWHIELRARHPDNLERLAFAVSDPEWPKAEIWVFNGLPHLRLVEIENLSAIDPSQTNLPPAWRNLPAYRVGQGDSMKFKVIRRGDPEPEPNQLNLNRKLWLDFDGGGYTVEDRIDGKMTQGWRLNVQEEMQLGQVQMNGRNQLITRLPDSEKEGIEVRRGALNIKADSRIEGAISRISAVGWQQDFRQVRAELNLPPGWRLLAAGGVDNDPNSWISRWTLLDLFMVLIAALAIGRLWNIGWGLFALLGLMLIWHETDAPRYVWLNILAAVALLRVLPEGRMSQLVKWYRNLAWLSLLIIAIPFMVDQVRVGLYPQLERQWQPISPPSVVSVMSPMVEEQATFSDEVAEGLGAIASAPRSKSVARKVPAKGRMPEDFERIDPDAKLQTGPGLPQWQWHQITLSWNGRVERSQQLDLWYLPPSLTMLLNFVRVALVVILSLLMFGMLRNKMKLSMPTWSLLLIAPLLGAPAQPAHADFPDAKLLEELKTRLLQPPECAPSCAQISAMQLNVGEQESEIGLEIHVREATAVPLPAHYEQWFPSRVTVDGETAHALLQRDDRLWLSLDKGLHRVEMQGANPPNHQFTLPLPLKPHRVAVASRGWSVEGVHEDGRADDQLQFTRLQSESHQEPAALQPSVLPPFIRVERTLRLGLDWRIDSRVVRVQHGGAPVVIEFPLLPGESVTSAEVRVKDGRVLVNMPAGQDSMVWQSALKKTERIELKADADRRWTEVWRADVAPVWHLEADGIAVVHHQDRQGRWLPEWRPWPGETVALSLTRPAAVAGATLTIDKADLHLKPGKRSQESRLQLQARSSKGGQHTIELPAGAVLQSVLIDGVTLPVRQQENSVTLPIKPGIQQFQLTWHENRELQNWLTTPAVDLKMSSVNSNLQVILGHDRWVLFTFGPKFGPAALIWGVLIVLALLSVGLGKLRMTPLKHWQWFLLLIGLSQIPVWAGLLVVFWLIMLGWRREKWPEQTSMFNLYQVALAGVSLIALLLLFFAVQQGLLGSPDMQIAGNQSNAFNLNWYQDRNASILPTATVISAPLFVYRILMLLWSLWLAVSLLDWLKWGWQCFSSGGLWKKVELEEKQDKAEEKRQSGT